MLTLGDQIPARVPQAESSHSVAAQMNSKKKAGILIGRLGHRITYIEKYLTWPPIEWDKIKIYLLEMEFIIKDVTDENDLNKRVQMQIKKLHDLLKIQRGIIHPLEHLKKDFEGLPCINKRMGEIAKSALIQDKPATTIVPPKISEVHDLFNPSTPDRKRSAGTLEKEESKRAAADRDLVLTALLQLSAPL